VRKAAAYAEEQAKTVGRRQEVPAQPAALESAPVSHALYRALQSQNKINIPSPSKSGKSLLVAPFAHFVTETPLTVKTNLSPTQYASFGERPDTYSAASRQPSSGRPSSICQWALGWLARPGHRPR